MPPRTPKDSKTDTGSSKRKPRLDPSREWSIDELAPHVGEGKPAAVAAIRKALLGAQSVDQLASLGAGFRTEDILASAPGFIAGTLLAIEALGGPPRGFAPELLPLLIAETRELMRVNTAYEEQVRGVASRVAGRRAQLKSANSRGLRVRRAAARLLMSSVLPLDHEARSKLQRAAGRADTATATVASVRAIAEIVSELREDETLRTVLDLYKYDDAAVTELRALADEIETLDRAAGGLTPPVEVSQRVLDRQDGTVLTLMRAIWTPFRDAREEGHAVDLPSLGSVARLVARSEAEDDVDPDAPVDPSEPTPAT